jgi:hypothetical protein
MQPTDIIALVGAASVPIAGLIWWIVRMSWAAAKRDAVIDGLGKALDALKARVDDHDDLAQRTARLEQSVHDLRSTVQALVTSSHQNFDRLFQLLSKQKAD